MIKIMLLNDTITDDHIGCYAVTNATNKMIEMRGGEIVHRYFVRDPAFARFKSSAQVISSDIGKQMEHVDWVIANGEGTLHHNNGRWILLALEAAQALGKKTAIVNSLFQEMNIHTAVFQNLDHFSVREDISSREATQRGIENTVLLDSCIEASWSDAPNTNIYDGKIVLTDYHDSQKKTGDILNQYAQNNDVEHLPLAKSGGDDEWKYAVANIKKAKLLITARHHGIYLAGLAGIPFIALHSNSHKMRGIIETSGLPIPFCENYSELDELIEYSLANPKIFQDFHDMLMDAKPLSTFDFLSGK